MKRILLVFALLAYQQSALAANTVYVTQSGAGTQSGVDAANAKPLIYFNSSGNWSGSPTGVQIGPDTTVHAVGTFTGTAGATGFTFQGSGTSGHPVTLLFDSGAVMNAPYWGTNDGTNPTGGAVTANGLQYITIDGGTNGTINDTDNGTALGHQNITAGVVINDTSHVTVKNLTINNLYVRTQCSDDPNDGSGATNLAANGVFSNQTGGSAVTDVNIFNNTIPAAKQGVVVVYGSAGGGVSNVSIYGNTLSREAPGIVFASRGAGSIMTTYAIHDNDISQAYYWWDFNGGLNPNHHLNGIHTFAAGSGTTMTGGSYYNNYIHDDISGGTHCGLPGSSHETSHIYIESTGGGSITGALVYNNKLTSSSTNDWPGGGWIGCAGANFSLYNNTILGFTGGSSGDGMQGCDNATIKNNIFENMDHALFANGSGMINTADYNSYYQVANGFRLNATTYNFASWQSLGYDSHAVNGVNPNLDGTTLVPNAGSSVIGLGQNLTSLSITPLNSDASGVARPVSNAWDAGALSGTAHFGPPPPFGLMVHTTMVAPMTTVLVAQITQ